MLDYMASRVSLFLSSVTLHNIAHYVALQYANESSPPHPSDTDRQLFTAAKLKLMIFLGLVFLFLQSSRCLQQFYFSNQHPHAFLPGNKSTHQSQKKKKT